MMVKYIHINISTPHNISTLPDEAFINEFLQGHLAPLFDTFHMPTTKFYVMVNAVEGRQDVLKTLQLRG